jgi:hypothetical protein
MGEKRKAYRILMGKPEEKRSLGRSRILFEDIFKTDLKGIGSGDVYWINLAQDRGQW